MNYRVTIRSPWYNDNREITIHDTARIEEGFFLENPRIVLEDNEPGTLDFSVPVNHYYAKAVRKGLIFAHSNEELTVYRNGKYLWTGSISDIGTDFYNRITVHCEGALSYLKDTIQPLSWYGSYDEKYTPADFIDDILDVHNNAINLAGQGNYISFKKIKRGIVTVMPDQKNKFARTTNLQSTYECITTKLIGRYGGHVRIRKVDGELYLDYFLKYSDVEEDYMCKQTIEFGKNMLDYNTSSDFSELFTVVVPIGEKLQKGDVFFLDGPHYGTLEQRMHAGFCTIGGPIDTGKYTFWYPTADHRVYLPSSHRGLSYREFGYKEKIVEFDDVTVRVYKQNNVYDYEHVWASYDEFKNGVSASQINVTEDGHTMTLEEAGFGNINYSKAYAHALKVIGENYLENTQFDALVLEISAVELHDTFKFNSEEEFDVLKMVYCSSSYHGMKKKAFPITKMELSLANDELPSITLNKKQIASMSKMIALRRDN